MNSPAAAAVMEWQHSLATRVTNLLSVGAGAAVEFMREKERKKENGVWILWLVAWADSSVVLLWSAWA